MLIKFKQSCSNLDKKWNINIYNIWIFNKIFIYFLLMDLCYFIWKFKCHPSLIPPSFFKYNDCEIRKPR